MTVTYSSYLKLDELLALQQPRPGELEHDETLFVIIHQVYELWFKEVLHELDYLMRMLRGNDTPLAAATLKRILTILKTLVAQIDVLETMTPLNFLTFRDRLEAGSGFQSHPKRVRIVVFPHHEPARGVDAQVRMHLIARQRTHNRVLAPTHRIAPLRLRK